MARMAAVGFSIGSKGYFGTGEHIIGQIYTRVNDFYEFDPADSGGMGKWTEKTKINNDVNLVRAFAVGFSIGNKGYIGTGHHVYGVYNDFWEYDPNAGTDGKGTWSQKTNFPGTARWQAVGMSIGAYGYVGLGDNRSDFYEYNPTTNTWTQKASSPFLPFPDNIANRALAAGFSIGNKLYIGTGSIKSGSTTHYKDFWECTPAAIWSGATNNEWTAVTNWLSPSIPVAGTDVTIPALADIERYPTINSTAVCRNLTIINGAKLTIGSGKSLSVNGTFVNYAGITGLVLKSDAYSTAGSLIHNTSGVYATVERYITATNWTNPINGWHLLSSPVSSQSINGTWKPSGTGNDYDFYALNESKTAEYWLNQKVGANNITSFIPGTGYLVAYEQTGASPRIFEGVINTSDLTLPGLTNTATSSYPGFHLVGNPFTSAINWNSGSWTKTNIDANEYVWDNGAYKSTVDQSVTGIIPSMNGFMIRVSTTAGGTLKIPANSRIHDATNWKKSSINEMVLLKANDIDGGTSQSSIVRFNPQATVNFDTEFDSYFASGFAPMFYSVTSGNNLLLNTLPEISETPIIPFAFIKNNAENFSIELAKSLPGVNIYLEDLKTNALQNLTENPVYKFTSAEGDDPARFRLHFQDLLAEYQETFNIYQNNSNIYINTLQTDNAEIMISNMLGQVVLHVKTNGNPLTTLNSGSLQSGVYMISLSAGSKVVSKKIVVSK